MEEIVRFLENWESYDGLNPRELFGPAPIEIDNWNSSKEKIEAGRHLFVYVLPVMKKIGEHVSVLQGRDYPTGSLVRPAMQDIKRSIIPLDTYLTEIQDSEDEDKVTDYLALADFSDAFRINFERYVGEEYTNQFPYQVASLLDPRVLRYEGNPRDLINGLKDSGYLTYEEIRVERVDDIDNNNHSALMIFSRLTNAGAEPTSLVDRELNDYFRTVVGLDINDPNANPLKFWAVYGNRFPILRRAARRSLVTKASSATAESVFSTSGMIARDNRSRLTGSMVNKLTVLKRWLDKELPEDVNYSRRSDIRQRKVDLLVDRFQYGPDDEAPRHHGDEGDDEDEYAEYNDYEQVNDDVVLVGGEDEMNEDDAVEDLPDGDFAEMVEEQAMQEEAARFDVFQRANLAIEERERQAGIADIYARRAARDLVAAVNDGARAARIAARERQSGDH